MDKFRSLTLLRWWAVAWFVLGFGAALASPLIQPRTMELVCSNASGATLVVHHAGSNAVLDTVGMDCSLCLPSMEPPQPAVLTVPGWPITHSVPLPPPRVVAVAPTAAPPPARAPHFPLALPERGHHERQEREPEP